MKGSLLLYNLK